MTSSPPFEVSHVDDDGNGIIYADTGSRHTTRIPGALPGDLVHRTSDGGFVLEPRPSSGRREAMLCSHFKVCGGCTVQHMTDDAYSTWKIGALEIQLQTSGIDPEGILRPNITVPHGSRRRAVLSGRRASQGVTLGFHGHRSHDIVDIRDCVILRKSIVAALPVLRELMLLVTKAEGECRLSVLDTDSGLDVAIETGGKPATARTMRELAALGASARIARLTIAGTPALIRENPILTLAGTAVTPPPGAFVQAAAEAERAMQALITKATAKSKAIADLFSGLGTFTFAAARNARVLAVDSDRALIEALGDAARMAQGLKPIDTKVRDLLLDPMSPMELAHVDSVIFDPPRAGARAQAEAIAKSKVKTVVAVSCNPDTLIRDLLVLLDGGFVIDHITPIDQFLYTPHLEAVAVLRRGKK